MDTDTQTLANRFTDTVNRAPGVKLWLLRPLLTLLATGEPVTIEQLASQAGRTAEEIREALADMPDTEYDSEGRIIGNGLTHNPTPHRYQTGDRTLYAWCAMDTLVFPAIIGHTAHVTSPCRATGEPVRLTVTPGGLTGVEPAGAVVSLVTPDAPTSVRAAFCNQVHFFASTDAAKDWLTEHPDAQALPVTDAYDVGRPLIEQILSGTAPNGCC
ncbi:organomercurial lyase MerB [Saccharomonospora azurea]|uniref:Alkylmercury lyase n=1 Tax=Saccharomonospora azurea NA-128 TaxID=882081 RepID=H8G9B4_9PSEU|nr:organomercurial lyase MerB [Saccharomonospora azurea]EHY87499.1 Alkylmercury lyase [Saccharomonospora azurea NA-128]